jgi:hypothetical protein
MPNKHEGIQNSPRPGEHVFPSPRWIAWLKLVIRPLSGTMIAAGLLVNLLWPPWHIVESMSVCRVMYVRQGWLPSGPWCWAPDWFHAATNAAAWTLAWAWAWWIIGETL